MMTIISKNPILKHFSARAIQTSRESNSEALVMLLPTSFLTLANPLRLYAAKKHKRVKRTIAQKGVFQDLPYLKIEKMEGGKFKVIGHEGRHRTSYLPILYPDQISRMPVRFIPIGFDISEIVGSRVRVEAQKGTKTLEIKF